MDYKLIKRDPSLNNEELFEKANLGDAESKELLFKNNIPFVKKMAGKWKRKGDAIEFDDLMSLGMLAMCKAYESFDKNKNIKFISYLTRLIINEYNRELRHLMSKKLNKYTNISIDESIVDDGVESEITYHDVICNDKKSDYEKAINSLDVDLLRTSFFDGANDREKMIFDRVYMGDETLTGLAKEWGVTRAMSSLVNRGCLNKIKDIYNNKLA